MRVLTNRRQFDQASSSAWWCLVRSCRAYSLAFSAARCVLLAICFVAAQGEIQAAPVAADDFESYAEGSSLYDQGGGSGWVSNWTGNTESHSPFARAESGHISDQGKSLVLGADIPHNSSNSNVLQREFDFQEGPEVYIGWTLLTPSWADDFFQLYVNDIPNTGTGNSVGSSFSMVLSNDPAGESQYVLRKGGTGGQVASELFHTTGVPHQMVLKLSKSGGSQFDNYDEIALFVDQGMEGTATVSIDSTMGNNSLIGPALSVLHFRLGSQEPDEPLIIDNLKVATTYDEVLTTVVGVLQGDFNRDESVDAADYVVWRNGFGSEYTMDDYEDWRANFGASGTVGSGAAALAAVPEPAAGCLASLALAGWAGLYLPAARPPARSRRA